MSAFLWAWGSINVGTLAFLGWAGYASLRARRHRWQPVLVRGGLS
jgi:hypothetical protein